MVDKPKRVEAATLIEDFLSCRITNFHYDQRYPRSNDPALFAIYSIVENCILFLLAEFEYHGPKNFVSLSAQFKRIWYKLGGTAPPELTSPVWPFDAPEQLEAVRHGVSHP
ncbi:MAG: hypothetical protein WB952_24990 [Terriglobales bacterium]